MTTIANIQAREVFDSRGNPTVEVDVVCDSGVIGRAIVPSGASTGEHEAHELRDGDPQRLRGLGVRAAVTNVKSEIRDALVGLDVTAQEIIDQTLVELDGTPNKSRLGANSLLGVSMAAVTAAARATNRPRYEYLNELFRTICQRTGCAFQEPPTLPLLMVNMISGGLHAGRNLDLQDFLLIPVGAENYRQSFEWIVESYHQLGRLLRERGFEGQLAGD